ncbi:MAG TPA: Gfo/Idh/MocA family oxidoreductase [Kiritimatiellia bacterium]|nr:Gfo/Idh/MocA family oxidoreductase [Kiritimatiellia bacterium]HOR98633.1 Gfo/Idh/MocA family oxidoreductase [Kiritimatiellia bacterium]HPC48989.1 Gfo/Idh/MocA family oxidoreductase [Kiritimatiellia bacterium]HPK37881.1 Gfo/Idh/MocA family oxidoreductase [Kiritimatiellia bacterium]HRU19378.1 Gfo/Idh/MocA family oxidoreductase [Kiritimatiellia bacterium]
MAKLQTGITRRAWLGKSGFTAGGFLILPRSVIGASGGVPPSGKLNIGCVGIGGQGGGVAKELATFPEVNLAAFCDVEAKHAERMRKTYPGRPFYSDYRVMLEKEKGLDAVMIGTPDHWHAPIALAAMRRGKHVYVEKPMAHTIEEARRMGEVAAETGVVTQMGNQGHAGEGLRLTKEWLDAGAIGAVREVHVWSDRPGTFWNTQGRRRPAETPPVPPTLDWDLWQGPAPEHPYHPDYVPRRWRGWFDYGCGALGDMMVHNADPAWYALNLGAPDAVEAVTSETNPDSFPQWSIVTWHFAAKGARGPVRVVWYDGGKRPAPPPGLEAERELGDNGLIFLGEKGAMMCPGWSGTPRLVPESAMKTFERPPKTIPRSPGHRKEWVQACIAGRPEEARAGFHYSAPFTEALLVGVLPIRLGKRIEWDAAAMRAKNAPEADVLIRKPYRKGFGLNG